MYEIAAMHFHCIAEWPTATRSAGHLVTREGLGPTRRATPNPSTSQRAGSNHGEIRLTGRDIARWRSGGYSEMPIYVELHTMRPSGTIRAIRPQQTLGTLGPVGPLLTVGTLVTVWPPQEL